MARVVLAAIPPANFTATAIRDAVTCALTQLDGATMGKHAPILIKPNLCYYWEPSTGETTDPRVVSAVIDVLRATLGHEISIQIVEADASAMKTRYAFTMLGYEALSRDKRVDLVNLSEGNIVEKTVTVGDHTFSLPVNDLLLKPHLLINIPKLKTHNRVGVTGALKNMFGAIAKPRKFSYHPRLAEVIVGMNKLIPSPICVVDGLIARGKHPKRLGVLLAGDDALATDLVVAKILGINPRRIEYLRLAETELAAEIDDLLLIEDGITLKEVQRRFPRTSFLRHRILWALQLRLMRLYARVTGDVIPPILEE